MNDSISDDKDMETPRYILRRRPNVTNWILCYYSLLPIDSNNIHGLIGEISSILCIILTMIHMKMQVLNIFISNPQQQSVQTSISTQTD